MRLILDVGSGASLPNDGVARRFVDEVAKRDRKKHEIIFKAQLFKEAPPNTPLAIEVFHALWAYARNAGYQCTASVFDKESLEYLLTYEVPFVKIACRPDLYWLAGEVPRRVPVYISCDVRKEDTGEYEKYIDESMDDNWMLCVPEYPATPNMYPNYIPLCVSDHTIGWELLYRATRPSIWEKHMRLPETTGPDAGPWAVLPDELAEVI